MGVHRLLLEGDRLIVEIDQYRDPHGSRKPPPEGKQYRFNHFIAVEGEIAYTTCELKFIMVRRTE